MATEDILSKDKDKCSVDDPEQRIPSSTTISASARDKSRLSSLSRGALRDELTYQLSSSAKMDLKTLETRDNTANGPLLL